MKRLIRIIIALTIIAGVLKFVGPEIFKPSTVRAFGDLTVNFHVPTNAPIFVVNNMKPGDMETRNVDVSNGGSTPHLISVKGVRTGGTGADPKLETILDIVIKDGATPVYGSGSATGSKTVNDFFTDSSNPDSVQLNTITPGNSKTYNFIVTFPSPSGNDFQAKSVIFDIIFGDGTPPPSPTPTSRPTPTPTPTGNLCSKIKVDISGNGTGSVNGVIIVCKNFKVVKQTNTTIVNTIIKSTTSTGGNSTSGNTSSSATINSGSSTNTTIVNVTGGTNTSH